MTERRKEGGDRGVRGRTVRHTVVGVAAGTLVFLGLGLYLNVATGFEIMRNPGPVGVLTVIGAPVGGLVGPLAGALLGRIRDGGS